MSRRILQCLIIVMGIFFQYAAFAALNLELTQGIDAALPIAIIPFANEQADVSGGQTLTQIITSDLQNSGLFKVKKAGLLAQKPTSAAGVDVSYWRKQSVDDVLVGRVEHVAGNRFRVAFELVGLFADAQKNETQQAGGQILFSETFTTTQPGLRRLAHHISDLIYQKLTGVRGIFSTRITYILVQRQASKPTKYTLEVADEDGFNPQALLTSTEPIMSPAWSPDGTSIAYVSFENHQAAIYLQNLATGTRRIVTNYPGVNGAPAFSPQGKDMALVLTTTGNPKIYDLNLKSGTLKQLTFGYSIDTEPAFSSNGRSILFTSNRGGTPQIYSYDFATGKVGRITFDGNYNARASYLPQENAIIMMHRETGMFGIAKQDLTTGRVDVLTQTGVDESPSLAPNGKMVLYATQYGGRYVLAMVSTDGRIKLRLPAREGSVQEPAWSPFLN